MGSPRGGGANADLHPVGRPFDASGRRCGDCAWAEPTPDGLRCARTAPSGGTGTLRVAANDAACVDFEPPVDCATCGACCREAFDAVPVEPHDHEALAALPVIRHADGWMELPRVPCAGGTRCAQLRGDGTTAPFRCATWSVRPSACRDLEPGSANCLLARTRVGLSPPG